MAAGPAWDAVNDAIGDDGHVSKDTALQGFALAFGGLPGVTPPPGDPGTIPSGSMALRWLVGYWDQLTTAQRAAAVAAVPDLAGLARTSRAPGAVTLAVAHPPRPAGAGPQAAQRRSNTVYTQLANQMAGLIGSHLTSGAGFDLTVDARFGTPVDWTAWMETSVLDAKGGTSGIPAKCLITVSAAGDARSDADVSAEMAHEVWHCYEGAIAGLERYWDLNRADWIMEGEAAWVAATLVPEAPLHVLMWRGYFDVPDVSLFKRTYSAIGFFGHLEGVAIDPWTKLVDVLQAKDNEAAFAAAGANTDPFLDSWASSLLDGTGRQQPWTLTGPAKPSAAKVKPGEIHLSNGGSVEVSAARLHQRPVPVRREPRRAPDRVHRARPAVRRRGPRLPGQRRRRHVLACRRTGCECPGATADEPPMPALDGADVALGVTGGPKGSSGTLTGTKLDDYCNKGITGTWDGSAEVAGYNVVNEFTMTLVQRGNSFKGPVVFTGPNCVHEADVTGTVSGTNITMQWSLAGLDPVNLEGTLSGKTMSGTFTAIGCPPERLSIGGPWSATKRK